ncbi:50S ribosomal protein L3 N(5)-glutamine methyltransferase [Nitrosomonas sp. HPC101]|uniref:50S ribosomal protein L3 N(5)-glutamine methyltransferase n=1 Tax=Nitrosomonas sp. HPC101 TaxID=1658667 RepID=UPI00137082C8|nr:50S ribosomal protein L3 N(5)-glutamine methyltransferase [Nitrosomonas sp. HPC101]MXS85015.1 50S ribosomal protein L3 N(5)-glutamine methyltransferase [Nitrosomonas sp. HPC101]
MTHTRQPNNPTILQAGEELRTLRDLLRFAISYFNRSDLFLGHGLPSIYDEAAFLIMHTLHLSSDQLDLFMDATLTGSERDQVLRIIERRVSEKMPVAYLTHEAWLGDFNFYVDERVIIPRSFIAELLQDRLSPWVADPYDVNSALDLCTGSGCLAILLAHSFEQAQIDAVDISSDALDVASINIRNYDLTSRINLIHSDLFTTLQGKRYDLLISNPPYVNATSMAMLPEEYRHEPAIALAGGLDGLDVVHQILKEAADHLTEDGLLIMEIGHNQSEIEQAFPQLPCTWLETSAGSQFVLMIRRCDLPT